jgi:hypothetical protein
MPTEKRFLKIVPSPPSPALPLSYASGIIMAGGVRECRSEGKPLAFHAAVDLVRVVRKKSLFLNRKRDFT